MSDTEKPTAAEIARLERLGKERHETCRHGTLTPSWSVEASGIHYGRETPGVMALCTWHPDGDVPPAVLRVWGGCIEFARDCAVCPCYQTVQDFENDPNGPSGSFKNMMADIGLNVLGDNLDGDIGNDHTHHGNEFLIGDDGDYDDKDDDDDDDTETGPL